MRLFRLFVMSVLFGSACHQGHVRFAQTRVPVVFGDRDTIGAAPSSAQYLGRLSTAVGEGDGTSSTGGGTFVSWSWSRPTEALDRTVRQATMGVAPAAIRRLRIRADTRLVSVGMTTGNSVAMHVTGDVVRVVTPPPFPPPTAYPLEPLPTAPVSAADSGYIGTWEGPWDDAARGQHGRLYIEIRRDGVVSGWMMNTSSNTTGAVSGALRPAATLDLVCRWQPSPPFAIRGALAADGTGDVRAGLTLSTTAGVFGTALVTLKRFVR